jgi:carboxylate-amine ligase
MSEGAVEVGVEEEFLLVDAETGRPAPLIDEIIGDAEELAGDAAQEELHRAQIETATSPCVSLDDLRRELIRLRSDMAEAASRHGARVVASGTFPGLIGREGRLITAKDRYQDLAAGNALIADEQLICGCHVHVSVAGRDSAIRVVNRLRRWLPVLLALSANSPYWDGVDTGYASFRTEVWARWPTSGPPGRYDGAADYERVIDALVRAGVVLDRGMAYWDARISDNYPTVEIRVADVGLTVDDAVAIGGLCRALVVHLGDDDAAPEHLRPEWQRAANWMAARGGLSGDLLDPSDGTTRPARRAVADMMEMLAPTLDRLGDRGPLTELVGVILDSGTGSERQRAAHARRQRLEDVIDLAEV